MKVYFYQKIKSQNLVLHSKAFSRSSKDLPDSYHVRLVGNKLLRWLGRVYYYAVRKSWVISV